MSFDDYEESVQDSTPVELYAFVAPAFAYFLTSGEVDVLFGGFLYKATPKTRSNLLTVDASTDSSDVTIDLPSSHPLCAAYAPGIPVRELKVTISRYQPASGVALQLWTGYASGLTYSRAQDGPVCTFRVPSGTGDTLEFDIPSVLGTRICNHVLYDPLCTVARAAYERDTTIASISADGLTIGIASIGTNPAFNAGGATHGEIVHVNSTERRTIITHNGNTIKMQCAFPNGSVQVGDAVQVFAGCDHLLPTCRTKFNNDDNYGGMYYMPPTNVFYVGLAYGRYFQ